MSKTQTKTDFERVACGFAASRGAGGTREIYLVDLGRWIKHCKRLKVDPAAPTLEAATSFRDALQDVLAALTVRRILSALSSMYEAACANRAATWNPFRAQALPRPPSTDYAKTEALSDADAEKIIAAAEAEGTDLGFRDAAVLRILYETGLRISPVAMMLRSNLFDRGDQQIARVLSKGAKLVEVEIPAKARLALDAWLARAPASNWVFPSEKNFGKPLARGVFSVRLKVYAKAAGISGKVHPHRFRASYATAALDAGVPLVDVQRALHHADPSTTLRYDRGKRGAGVADAVAKFRQRPS